MAPQVCLPVEQAPGSSESVDFIIPRIAWLIVWAALHLVGGGIHLLLALPIIFLIVHFVRGRHAV